MGNFFYLNSSFNAERPEDGDLLEVKGLTHAVDGLNVHLKVVVRVGLIFDLKLRFNIWASIVPIQIRS